MSNRYVHVNHRYAPYYGGSERFVQEISERFATDGNAVKVVTTDAYDLEYFWDPRRRSVVAQRLETIAGVEIERVTVRHVAASSIVFRGTRRIMGEAARLPIPAAPFQLFARYQPWLPGFEDAIVRARPGLVHATNLGLEGLAVTARRVARCLDIPFILTPFIHLGGANDRVARRYVSMPHQRALLRDADAIFTMTETEAEYVSSVGVRDDLVHVVGAGINPSELTGGDGAAFRRRHNISGILVGSIGVLAADKGTPDLVRAVQRLRGHGHAVHLVLAGATLSAFERWYTALDERERDGVHVLGVIGPEEKRDMLDAIDMFALPSRTESFGIVFLEAWANRKPVIAADAGAVPELVRDRENGLLVPFGHVSRIADAIDELCRDAALRDRLGKAGEALVLARYTWDMVFERVRTAYDQVLGTTGRG